MLHRGGVNACTNVYLHSNYKCNFNFSILEVSGFPHSFRHDLVLYELPGARSVANMAAEQTLLERDFDIVLFILQEDSYLLSISFYHPESESDFNDIRPLSLYCYSCMYVDPILHHGTLVNGGREWWEEKKSLNKVIINIFYIDPHGLF